MPKFDPVKWCETLLGGIRFDLAADFNEISARGCLTGYGLGFHGTAIEAILVGFDEPAVWLLEKATRWLGAAIAAEEDQYSSTEEDPYRSWDGTRSLQYESMAQCNWLLTGVHDFENLRCAVHYTNRYYSDYAWESDDLVFSPPLYCEAEEVARACEIFESVVENAGRQNPEDVARRGQHGVCHLPSLTRACIFGGRPKKCRRRFSATIRSRSFAPRALPKRRTVDETDFLGRGGIPAGGVAITPSLLRLLAWRCSTDWNGGVAVQRCLTGLCRSVAAADGRLQTDLAIAREPNYVNATGGTTNLLSVTGADGIAKDSKRGLCQEAWRGGKHMK